MAILKKCAIFWVKCDPAKPNGKMDPNKPQWEAQLRTKDKAQAKEWKDNFLPVKLVEDEKEGVYYRANIRKRAKKADGTPNKPVNVVDGSKKPLDPNRIGNGSIANVRVFIYEYPASTGGMKKTAMLTDLQITTLNEYVPKPREDDFDEEETIVNAAGGMQDNSDISDDDTKEEDIPF